MTDYPNLSDLELIILLQEGEHAAFTEIYNRYFVIIFFKVNQMLRDQQASEDIVQDLFIKLWAKPNLLKLDNNLGGYLYVCARNSVLKVLHKDKLRSDYLSSLAEYALDVSLDTLNEISERELSTLLQEEIAKLPTKMRIVFELSRNQNLSHAEIAQRMNITEQTVNKQVSNALKILRERLSAFAPAALILIALAKRS